MLQEDSTVMGEEILKIENLTIQLHDTVPATEVVRNFSLSMEAGEIVGIVGESGSGKTMTALAVMGLLRDYAQMPSGSILFQGKELLSCSQKEWEKLRGGQMSMIFQEPMTSLNPVLTVGSQVEESLLLHTDLPAPQRRERVLQMLREVELPDPEQIYKKYPHQLSGGMRQRVMIAAALINEPRLMIADEPTTALDVTIQSQIIRLLKKMNREHGTAILFISHNLGVVKSLCSRMVVMNQGVAVESGTVEEIFTNPHRSYTKRLLEAIPNRRESMRRRQIHG